MWQAMVTAGDKETDEVQVIKFTKLSGMTIKAGWYFSYCLGQF